MAVRMGQMAHFATERGRTTPGARGGPMNVGARVRQPGYPTLRRTPMPALDLSPATARLAEVCAGIRDDQLSGPTPCAGMTVADLLDHVHGLGLAFRVAATRAFEEMGGDVAPVADGANLAPAWRTEIPERLEAMATAWTDPAAWDGMTQVGGIDLPAEVCALVGLDEVVVHGWDLAVATGQAFTVDPALLQAVHGFVEGFEPPPEAEGNGLFGPPVAVPDGAPLLDRTLGLTGRDPRWTP